MLAGITIPHSRFGCKGEVLVHQDISCDISLNRSASGLTGKMQNAGKDALLVEVSRLQEQVKSLQSENAEFHRLQSEAGLAPSATLKTMAANAARRARSAELDAKVLEAAKQCASLWGAKFRTDHEFYQSVYFHHSYRFRVRVVAHLIKNGIPAPRGGQWSARQVNRALVRHALRDPELAACISPSRDSIHAWMHAGIWGDNHAIAPPVPFDWSATAVCDNDPEGEGN